VGMIPRGGSGAGVCGGRFHQWCPE